MRRKYNQDSITWLKGLEGVRAKPALYIGEADSTGIIHLAKEIIGNSIDEAVNGFGATVGVKVEKGTITIFDQGRGIPVGRHKDNPKQDVLTILATQLHSGGKLNAKDGNYETSLGSHGLGLAVVNALSTSITIWSFRNRKWYSQSFRKGKAVTPKPVVNGPTPPTLYGKRWPSKGTIIKWTYDPSVFDKGSKLLPDNLVSWVKAISWFTSYTRGTRRRQTRFLLDINGKRSAIHRTDLKHYVIERVAGMKKVEIMNDTYIEQRGKNFDLIGAWTTSPELTFDTSVNSAQTVFGGTHAKGATKAFEDVFKALAKRSQSFRAADLMTGFVGCFNLRIPSPRFDSQSKGRLTSPTAEKLAYDAVYSAVSKWAKDNKESATEVLSRACAVYSASNSAKLNRQLAAALKTRKAGKSNLPPELIVSTTKKPEDRELFIVEGLSASGSSKKASTRETQEVLPLRGKVLNVAKVANGKMNDSMAIVNMLKAIGYDPNNPEGKLRIGKIMVLSDPDPDGPLVADTLIPLFGSEPMTIKDMADKWEATEQPFKVYAQTKNGKIIVAEAIDIKVCKISRTTVNITMEDGMKMSCSTGHKWAIGFTPTDRLPVVDALTGISYLPADTLRIGDTLVSLGGIATKILAIGSVDGEVETDFYCMTVPGLHNFFVSSGIKGERDVLSSNCHISSLVLTLLWQTLPHLFGEGRVFVVDAPLFIYSTPKQKYYGNSLKDLATQAPGKIDTTNVTRLKGYGEMMPEDLRYIAFNPDTRRLKQVEDPGEHSGVVQEAMGSDLTLRKQILGLS